MMQEDYRRVGKGVRKLQEEIKADEQRGIRKPEVVITNADWRRVGSEVARLQQEIREENSERVEKTSTLRPKKEQRKILPDTRERRAELHKRVVEEYKAGQLKKMEKKERKAAARAEEAAALTARTEERRATIEKAITGFDTKAREGAEAHRDTVHAHHHAELKRALDDILARHKAGLAAQESAERMLPKHVPAAPPPLPTGEKLRALQAAGKQAAMAAEVARMREMTAEIAAALGPAPAEEIAPDVPITRFPNFTDDTGRVREGESSSAIPNLYRALRRFLGMHPSAEDRARVREEAPIRGHLITKDGRRLPPYLFGNPTSSSSSSRRERGTAVAPAHSENSRRETRDAVVAAGQSQPEPPQSHRRILESADVERVEAVAETVARDVEKSRAENGDDERAVQRWNKKNALQRVLSWEFGKIQETSDYQKALAGDFGPLYEWSGSEDPDKISAANKVVHELALEFWTDWAARHIFDTDAARKKWIARAEEILAERHERNPVEWNGRKRNQPQPHYFV